MLFALLTQAFRPSTLSGTRLPSWYGFGERIASGPERRDSLPAKAKRKLINPILANALMYLEYIKALAAIDLNHDGYLSADEIAVAPDSLVRLSAGGRLTANECGMRTRTQTIADPQIYAAAIIKYDTDGDGKLDVYELPGGMKGLVRQADTNGDFLLSPAEIRAFAMSPEQSRDRGILRHRQSLHMRFHPALVALDSNHERLLMLEKSATPLSRYLSLIRITTASFLLRKYYQTPWTRLSMGFVNSTLMLMAAWMRTSLRRQLACATMDFKAY